MENPLPPLTRSTPVLSPDSQSGPKSLPLNKILFLISATSLILTGFFIYQNWQLNQKLQQLISAQQVITPTPTQATTPTPTCRPRPACLDMIPACKLLETPDMCPKSTWKTYTNTKYGYSFSYPPTWTIKAIAAGSGEQAPSSDSAGLDLLDPTRVGQVYPDGVLTFQVFQLAPTFGKEFNQDETYLDGVKVIVYSGAIQGLNSVSYIIELPNKTGYLEIDHRYKPDGNSLQYPPILSTFRFFDCGGPKKIKCSSGKACKLFENYSLNPNSYGTCVPEAETQP